MLLPGKGKEPACGGPEGSLALAWVTSCQPQALATGPKRLGGGSGATGQVSPGLDPLALTGAPLTGK